MPSLRPLSAAELERVNHASSVAQDRVNLALSKAAMIAGDGDSARRVADRKCKRCHYNLYPTIVGHAFTNWACALCGTEGQHHNTGVPRVCAGCSDGYGLCVCCGGDIDMKFRTKRFGRKSKRGSKKAATNA